MRRGGLWRACGVALAALIVAADCTPAGQELLRLPSLITIAAGQSQRVGLGWPGRLAVRGASGGLVVDGSTAPSAWQALPGGALDLLAPQAGTYTLHLRLFGVVPWRAIRVEAVAVPALVPGGQTVGIVLSGRQPLVVGFAGVPSSQPTAPSPAREGGLRVGDALETVGGIAVRTQADVSSALQRAAGHGPVALGVLRDGRQRTILIRPVRDGGGLYRMGAWVRDGSTGIGTLTFFARPGGIFGALGHAVADPTTGQAVVLGGGTLLPALISGLEPSRDGHPGEKVGVLPAGAPPLGQVTANTDLGVFGTLSGTPGPGPLTAPVPVALPDQVHPGPATLLTVTSGLTVQTFAARITAVLPQRTATVKGFVLRVTDPGLLSATGGIVQGMSGSPVLQDGRLVGAVTHVFVDDPARGYGVLALWMAQAAGAGTAAAGGV